jgi:hypothetical protein
MSYWRNKSRLSVPLKGHIMEKHACDFNDSCGLGDKDKSFVEQGHQVGMKDDRRYHRLTNFVKQSDSTMKAQSVSSHPAVKEQKEKVVASSKGKRVAVENDGNADQPTKAQSKKDMVKNEKEKKTRRVCKYQ